jgi:hypothetical protein
MGKWRWWWFINEKIMEGNINNNNNNNKNPPAFQICKFFKGVKYNTLKKKK